MATIGDAFHLRCTEVEVDTSIFIWAEIAEPAPYAGISLLRHITKM
jgi:hypothetical protein